MGSVASSGLPEGNGQCRRLLLPANISHQAHAISCPYQTCSNIQRLRIWEFLERVQLLAIHGTARAMSEGGGWIPRRYCWILLANAGCLG